MRGLRYVVVRQHRAYGLGQVGDWILVLRHEHLRHEAGVYVLLDVDTDFVAAVTGAAEPVEILIQLLHSQKTAIILPLESEHTRR